MYCKQVCGNLVLFNNLFLDFDMCKRRILSMNGLPGLNDEISDEDRNIYFSSRVPFECYSMVCHLCICIGSI